MLFIVACITSAQPMWTYKPQKNTAVKHFSDKNITSYINITLQKRKLSSITSSTNKICHKIGSLLKIERNEECFFALKKTNWGQHAYFQIHHPQQEARTISLNISGVHFLFCDWRPTWTYQNWPYVIKPHPSGTPGLIKQAREKQFQSLFLPGPGWGEYSGFDKDCWETSPQVCDGGMCCMHTLESQSWVHCATPLVFPGRSSTNTLSHM